MSISAVCRQAPLHSMFRDRWLLTPCANSIRCLRRASKCRWRQGQSETEEDAEKIARARKQLRELGFEDQVIDRAAREAKASPEPQTTNSPDRITPRPCARWRHCKSVGLAYRKLRRAHERSFHRSLKVDDDFREQYQRPFDTVIRAVAVALQGRYVDLMRRVEELAAMTDRKQAAKLFASEIPGALPLQRHFFKAENRRLAAASRKAGPVRRAAGRPDEGASGGMRFRQWPAGNYLLRMAKTPDAVTRQGVAQALRNVASSKHPDVQYDGLEILAALPPESWRRLADLAVSWLSPARGTGRCRRPKP